MAGVFFRVRESFALWAAGPYQSALSVSANIWQ